MSTANVLLSRLLSLKETQPLILILDTLTQSSHPLLSEFAAKSNLPIVYLSYETIAPPAYATAFIDCAGLSPPQAVALAKKELGSRTLVVVDSFNYIPSDKLAEFTSSLTAPGITILGTYHTSIPTKHTSPYPDSLSLLKYIAGSILEVEAVGIEDATSPAVIGSNRPVFNLTLTNRRKSGRSLIYRYTVDTVAHSHDVRKEVVAEEENLMKDLTTFNLGTNQKQKAAREKVDLPYMEAQQAMGASGGAIVYEFEKDDDYDEEDPYEEPF